ncbi:MAG: DUF4381 domain-containing protein [Marinobacter sp.]|nr:DUF4381 domain-containing protein [Marinobacter sp.]
MMEQDPLSQLRDIHLPQTGGFWPPAPGWWILFALFIALLVAIALFIHRKRRKNRWLTIARRELNQLARRASPEPPWFARLNTLLKQCARERYPEERPEAMTGTKWADFLLKTSPDERETSRPIVEAMINSSWQPEASVRPEQALTFARSWLEGQKC